MDYNRMKISEFAKLTGLSRESLIFYDKQGLLKPGTRGSNGYRYYNKEQLNYAYLITVLRKIGISIKDIKKFYAHQSPVGLDQIFNNKINEIDDQINQLISVRDTLKLSSLLINETMGDNLNIITVKRLPLQKVYVGPIVDHNHNRDYDRANLEFYKFCNKHGISLISPFGMILSVNDFGKNITTEIKRCYFIVPKNNNELIDEGTYVVGYQYGDYNSIERLVKRVMEYVNNNELMVMSDIYIDYPFNEISNNDNLNPLIRCFIQVMN